MRYATDEDYKRLQNWSVGTFHTVSTLPTTETSPGEEKPPDKSEETLSTNNLATEEITMDKKQKKNGVFMMRGEGHTFEQFKAALMQRFEDEGFFQEEDNLNLAPSREPEPGEIISHNKAEAGLMAMLKRTGHLPSR